MTSFAELPENDATGELARIYAEIRCTYGAPYVSSLQRHLATFPGVLEWAWGIVGPGFHSGLIPETAWQIARDANYDPIPGSLDQQALAFMGVDQSGQQAITNICENFVRVAPLNLLFAGCIRAVLEGAELPGSGQLAKQKWQAPIALEPMPAMLAPESLTSAQSRDLNKLSTKLGDQTFTPGLYRMLVHWPGYLNHVATTVGPRLTNPEFQLRGKQLAEQIVGAVPAILDKLPPPPDLASPDASLAPRLIDATVTYRRTSPEMVIVGTRLLQELNGSRQQ